MVEHEHACSCPRENKPDAAGAEHRRGWFAALFRGGMALLAGAVGLATAATARFMMPNTVNEPARRFRVGPPGDLPPGTVETKYKEPYGVWLVNGKYRGRPEIFALSTRCTHLGCITVWQEAERKFACPCHGSGFDPAGINFEGPAPRPLERYAVHVADDGQIEVDTGRVFRQDFGQWDDPASFVVPG
jgi:cytochrome b6-f complex iron-sulfur subunit